MGPVFDGGHLKRRQLQNWIVLDLRRIDPMLPGLLIGERRLFGRTVEDPSELWSALLSSQITNHDPVAMTVTTDDLTRWQLLGPAGRLDEVMQRKLDPYLRKFCLLQWQQVTLMDGMD